MQPESRAPRPIHQNDLRERTPAAAMNLHFRTGPYEDAVVGGQGYEVRTMDGGEDIATNNHEGDFDHDHDDDDHRAMRTPIQVRKRRREPKKSLDTDERNVVFKKRKRNIMNEHQIRTIEDALKDQPEMQRYPKLIMTWTTELNRIVSHSTQRLTFAFLSHGGISRWAVVANLRRSLNSKNSHKFSKLRPVRKSSAGSRDCSAPAQELVSWPNAFNSLEMKGRRKKNEKKSLEINTRSYFPENSHLFHKMFGILTNKLL